MRPLRLLPLLLVLACFGCSRDITKPEAGNNQSDSKTPPSYSRSDVRDAIEKTYLDVVDETVKKAGENSTDKSGNNTITTDFILHNKSAHHFAQAALSQYDACTPATSGKHEDSFDDAAFSRLQRFSRGLAIEEMEHQKCLHRIKEENKKPVQLLLLKMDKKEKYTEFIDWVYGEISPDDIRKDASLNSYDPADGYTIYGFISPPDSWKHLSGRQGYFVVRKGHIVDVIITMMN